MNNDDSDTADLDELAVACRALAGGGHEDLTLGHLSLRASRGNEFWLKRPGRSLGEMQGATDFHRMTFDGDVEAGDAKHIEWPIHASILEARPEWRVVGHTHPHWGHLASCLSAPLSLVGNEAVAFVEGIPRFDETPDLIRTRELGDRLADALGSHRAVLLTHHGVAFGGSSIAEAALTGIYLERLCRSNFALAQSGLDFDDLPGEVAAEKATRTFSPGVVDSHWAFVRRTHESGQSSTTT